jgi:hypothetical protein
MGAIVSLMLEMPRTKPSRSLSQRFDPHHQQLCCRHPPLGATGGVCSGSTLGKQGACQMALLEKPSKLKGRIERDWWRGLNVIKY